MAISEQLREAIRNSGLSVYRIAKDSGVPQQTLQRFMTHERDVRLAQTADKLASYFKLELAPQQTAGKSAKKAR